MSGINELITEIDNKGLDEKFELLYNTQSEEELQKVRDRYKALVRGFREEFGEPESINLFSAPGRTEIGGNHTDHQLGAVLAGSVNYDNIAAAAPNGTDTIKLYSDGYGLTEIGLDQLEPVEEEIGTTASLIRGMASELKKRGADVKGFDAYVMSNVPSGSGISSSAAFEVLVGNIISELCGIEPDAVEIAKMAQKTENNFFGKPSGLMDQMASSVGGIVGIDFYEKEAPEVREAKLDLDKEGYALCIIDTKSSHEDLTDEYAAIPEDMKEIASYFGEEVLSRVDKEDFIKNIPALREKFDDRKVLRALHFLTDTQRAKEEYDALLSDDFDKFLKLVNESGNSSVLALQNITPAGKIDDQSVALALALAGELLEGQGAYRVHGGGFAGTIQAFVPKEKLEEFVETFDSVLGEDSAKIMSIRSVGGAKVY